MLKWKNSDFETIFSKLHVSDDDVYAILSGRGLPQRYWNSGDLTLGNICKLYTDDQGTRYMDISTGKEVILHIPTQPAFQLYDFVQVSVNGKIQPYRPTSTADFRSGFKQGLPRVRSTLKPRRALDSVSKIFSTKVKRTNAKVPTPQNSAFASLTSQPIPTLKEFRNVHTVMQTQKAQIEAINEQSFDEKFLSVLWSYFDRAFSGSASQNWWRALWKAGKKKNIVDHTRKEAKAIFYLMQSVQRKQISLAEANRLASEFAQHGVQKIEHRLHRKDIK